MPDRGELDRSLMFGERLLAMSDETRDRSLVLFVHNNAAFAKYYQGRFAASLAHCERVLALYDPARDRGGAFHHGFPDDPCVAMLRCAAANLWYLGHPDRSLGRAREGVTLARTLGEPFTLALALFMETLVHQWRRDWRAQRERATELIAVADVQSFPLLRGAGRIYRGLARVHAGEGADALTEIAEGGALAAGTGAGGGLPAVLSALADGQRAAGRHADALGTVESGLAVATATGQHFSDAGLHQLKGELLLDTDPASSAEAEALFCRALDIARAQEAKSFELRAATSLARLWQCQGKLAEARALAGARLRLVHRGLRHGRPRRGEGAARAADLSPNLGLLRSLSDGSSTGFHRSADWRDDMSTGTTAAPTQRPPELLGQTVVVIGGSAGIGLETARRARAEGAKVILTGRNPERLRQAASELGAPSTAAFDAMDPAALERFFRELPTPIDHVMVTAGGPNYKPLFEMDVAQLQRGLSDHLVLPIQVARNAAKQGEIGRHPAVRGRHRRPPPTSGLAIVSTVTTALPALTASLALELAPIRVNLIAPGFVDTPLSASLLGDQLENRRNQLRTTLPIGRVVGPADVAALAVHIMTNTALTGATYDIDGGQQFVRA